MNGAKKMDHVARRHWLPQEQHILIGEFKLFIPSDRAFKMDQKWIKLDLKVCVSKDIANLKIF